MSKMAYGILDDNEELRLIKLDRDIIELSEEECITDVRKLKTVLAQEHSKNRSIIGVVSSKRLLISLKENNTFTGIIWKTRTQISGGYTLL